MTATKARPASLLPFEVDKSGRYAYVYGRYPLATERRNGLPLRCCCLAQRKTGAKRGEHPRLLGFDPAELQDLEYLAHAASVYPDLVAALRWYAGTPDGGGVARDLLQKIGEAS